VRGVGDGQVAGRFGSGDPRIPWGSTPRPDWCGEAPVSPKPAGAGILPRFVYGSPRLDPVAGRGLNRLRQTVLDDIPAQAVP